MKDRLKVLFFTISIYFEQELIYSRNKKKQQKTC